MHKNRHKVRDTVAGRAADKDKEGDKAGSVSYSILQRRKIYPKFHITFWTHLTARKRSILLKSLLPHYSKKVHWYRIGSLLRTLLRERSLRQQSREIGEQIQSMRIEFQDSRSKQEK